MHLLADEQIVDSMILTSRSITTSTSLTVDVLSPDFSAMGSCEIYRRTGSDLTCESLVSITTHLEYRLHGLFKTREFE